MTPLGAARGVLARLFRLAGRRIVTVVLATIPLGILLGVTEIGIGFSLQNFLVAYGLLEAPPGGPGWLARLMHPVALVLVLTAIVVGLRYFSQFLPSYAYEAFSARIRGLITDNVMGREQAAADLGVADITHILSNLLGRAVGFVNGLAALCVAAFLLVTLLSGMFALSAELTGIALVTAVVFGAPLILLRRAYQYYGAQVYRHQETFTRRLVKGARNLLFLKLSGTTTRERDVLLEESRQVFANYLGYAIRFFANGVWPGFMAIVIVVAIVVGNARLDFVATAALVPFVYLLSRLASAIGQITSQTANLQYNFPFVRDLVAFDARLLESARAPASERGSEHIRPRRLVVTDLVVGRDRALLAPLTFELEAGRMLLISGPSGRGKTTLLMTLIGLIRPLGGTIRWNDLPLEQIDLAAFRRRIGYSGADPFLLDGTVRENLVYGLPADAGTTAKLERVLALARCEFVEALDGGLEHRLKEGGEGVSAGQKQRLSLARALLRDPDLLLLDEATANLDVDTEAAIFANIRGAFPELMIIAVSHRESLRSFANAHLGV